MGYRLFDIDVLVTRTLVYGTLTALNILSHRLLLAVSEQESQATVVVAALAVTVLFQPLRTRVQDFVDRRFYRRKYDTQRTLEAFSARQRQQVDLVTMSDVTFGRI